MMSTTQQNVCELMLILANISHYKLLVITNQVASDKQSKTIQLKDKTWQLWDNDVW